MKNTYATFSDPEMAEKAGGALLDHGIRAEHISIVLPEGFRSGERHDKEGYRSGERHDGEGFRSGERDDKEGYRSAERDDKNVGRDHSEGAVKSGITTTTLEDAQSGAAKGAGIGLAAGTVAALAAIFVPGVGLVMGGGALALALSAMAGTTAAGAVAGGVTGFLKDQGVPADVTEGYERIIRGGGALVTVFPTDEKVEQATIESILTKYNGVVSSYMPMGSAAVTVGDRSRAEDGSRFNA